MIKKIIFEGGGGVAVTDTSEISQRTNLRLKMRDGRIWWHCKNSLYLQDGDEKQKFTLPEGGSFDQITCLYTSAQWLGLVCRYI